MQPHFNFDFFFPLYNALDILLLLLLPLPGYLSSYSSYTHTLSPLSTPLYRHRLDVSHFYINPMPEITVTPEIYIYDLTFQNQYIPMATIQIHHVQLSPQ